MLIVVACQLFVSGPDGKCRFMQGGREQMQ